MDVIIKKRIKEVLKGDQDAYSEVVEAYKDRLYFLCYRMLGNRHEAEDIAQEAFIRAYVNLDSFNMDLKFTNWIYRIATNLCIDLLRKRKPDFHLDAEVTGTDGLTLYSQIPVNQSLPEEEVESLELQEMIQSVISSLPEKYRTVIILRYLEDFSLKEISEILNMPLGTVKTRLYRGRERLRRKLRFV